MIYCDECGRPWGAAGTDLTTRRSLESAWREHSADLAMPKIEHHRIFSLSEADVAFLADRFGECFAEPDTWYLTKDKADMSIPIWKTARECDALSFVDCCLAEATDERQMM